MSEKVEITVPALRVEKLYPNSVLPYKPKTNTDSGFDVVAHNVKKIYGHFSSNGEIIYDDEKLKLKFVEDGVFELQQGERALIGTGLKMTVGPGYEIQVRPRSGLALKQGLTVINTPGTIDEAFRDEVGIIVLNTSRQVQRITLGDPIAQIVPAKVELLEIVEEKLDDNTERGLDGFGSTNKSKFTDGMIAPIKMSGRSDDIPFNFMS